MATIVSGTDNKVQMYKTFFEKPTLTHLNVCGEGGTEKSRTLKMACEQVASHPTLEIVYTGEPSVTIPAKHSDAPKKTIVHCYKLDSYIPQSHEQNVIFV